jgi:hypothetical protein
LSPLTETSPKYRVSFVALIQADFFVTPFDNMSRAGFNVLILRLGVNKDDDAASITALPVGKPRSTSSPAHLPPGIPPN